MWAIKRFVFGFLIFGWVILGCEPEQKLGVGIHQFPPSEIAWQELQPGLEIAIVHQGIGVKVKKSDKVQVHYTAWYEGGHMIDSSIKKGRAYRFKVGVGRVIKAWDLSLVEVTKGSEYYLRSNSDFAFGDGKEDNVRGFVTVIFGIKLMN